MIGIPGKRVKRRTQIEIDGRIVELPDRLLKVLLHLIVARLKKKNLHKLELGHTSDKGFKQISELKEAIKSALGDGDDFINNDYHGNYSLADHVEVGPCNIENLLALDQQPITDLTEELRRLLESQTKV